MEIFRKDPRGAFLEENDKISELQKDCIALKCKFSALILDFTVKKIAWRNQSTNLAGPRSTRKLPPAPRR